MVSRPELGSDPPIGLDRESGYDMNDIKKTEVRQYIVHLAKHE